MAYLIEDLTIARGLVSIAAVTDGVPGEFTDLGNSPNFEIQLTSSAVSHRESRTPGRFMDQRVIVGAGYDLLFALDQRSVENLRLWLAAELAGTSLIEAGKYLDQDFAVRFVSDNRTGPNYIWEFWRCRLSPEQPLNLVEGGSWARLWFRAHGLQELLENAGRPYFTVRDSSRTYATWNPEDCNPSITLSDDLLDAASGYASPGRACRATIGVNTGRKYFEVVFQSLSISGYTFGVAGVGTIDADLTKYPGGDLYGWGYLTGGGSGYIRHNAVGATAQYINIGDVLRIAFDVDRGYVWFGKNERWFGGSGSEAFLIDLPKYTGLVGPIYPMCGASNSSRLTDLRANFGQADWLYGPPEGYGFEGVYI
ncbi:MAG: hypothetical protein V1816_10930 [Pseudomonadota bacterium]